MLKNTDSGFHLSTKERFHTLYILPLLLAIPVGLLAQASAFHQKYSTYGNWQNIQESQADFMNAHDASSITVKCDKAAQRLVLTFNGYSDSVLHITARGFSENYTLVPDEKGKMTLVFKPRDNFIKKLSSSTTAVTFEGKKPQKWVMRNNRQLSRITQYCWN